MQMFMMTEGDVTQCQCLASQVPALVTATCIHYLSSSCQQNKLTLTISYNHKVVITLYHDVPDSRFPGFSLLEFL